METAYKYGVNGLVMNKEDESVYIEAEGEDEAMILMKIQDYFGNNAVTVLTINQRAVKKL